MIRTARLLPVCLLLALLTGCAILQGVQKLSPVQKVTLAQNTYAAAVERLSDLRDAGRISDADALTIEKVLIGADGLLALARSKAVAGDAVGTDAALLAVLKVVGEIEAFTQEHRAP